MSNSRGEFSLPLARELPFRHLQRDHTPLVAQSSYTPFVACTRIRGGTVAQKSSSEKKGKQTVFYALLFACLDLHTKLEEGLRRVALFTRYFRLFSLYSRGQITFVK